MKNLLIILFIAAFANTSIFAQKDVDQALQGFLGTEFMTKFREMKTRAENAAKQFKLTQNNYPPEDVMKVRQAYDRTTQRFNQVLEGIKTDFLDSKKIKYIAEYPDSYSKGLELEMYKLSDYYAQNFQQTLADVTGNQIDGSIILLVTEIIALTKDVVDYIIQMKRAAKKFTDENLQARLIEPNKFKSWNEIITAQHAPPASSIPTPPNNGGFQDPNSGGMTTPPPDPNATTVPTPPDPNNGGMTTPPDPNNTGTTPNSIF